jgi:hypothetical protein
LLIKSSLRRLYLPYKDNNKLIFKRLVIASTAGVFQDEEGVVFLRCVKCLHANTIQEHGLRVMDSGELRSQSYCKKCRAAERKAAKK